MSEVQIFNNGEFGSVRMIYEDGKVLFAASDTAKALGYKNVTDAICRHCKGVVKHDTLTKGGKQQINFITEGDVYRLVTHSKLPSAERFESWVFDDVLPTLRKTGSYVMGEVQQRIQSDPMFAAEYFAKHFLEVAKDRDRLAKQIADEKPMVELGKGITKAVNDITIGEMAKILKQNGVDTGRTRFFQTLRDDGYLMTQNGEKNIPTQKAMNLGVFHVTMKTITLPHTNITRTTHQTMVTGKGQVYFFEKYTA